MILEARIWPGSRRVRNPGAADAPVVEEGGLAVCLVGLGLVERDGLVIIGGMVMGAMGMTLSLGFVYAIFAGLESLI